MLRPSLTNAEIRHVIQQAQAAWGDPAAWADEITWSWTADIDRLVDRLQNRYSAHRGRPVADSACLLRFLGLMTVREVASIVDGLRHVRQTP